MRAVVLPTVVLRFLSVCIQLLIVVTFNILQSMKDEVYCL